MEGANYEGPDRLSLKILMRCEALMARLVVHRVPPRDELLYDLPLLFCSSLSNVRKYTRRYKFLCWNKGCMYLFSTIVLSPSSEL